MAHHYLGNAPQGRFSLHKPGVAKDLPGVELLAMHQCKLHAISRLVITRAVFGLILL
jgi:hypothetical protein